MGRQWLHAKRLVAGLKKGRTTGKLVREISVAAKMGGADISSNARLFTAVATVSKWLSANGWTVVTSEIGYVPKQFPELTEAQHEEVGEFLHTLDEHDDVHRVWAAVK